MKTPITTILISGCLALSGLLLIGCGSSDSGNNEAIPLPDLSGFPYDDPSAAFTLIDPQADEPEEADLPAGLSTEPEINRKLNTFYEGLRASGGEVYLRYAPNPDNQIFNVRIRITDTDIINDSTGTQYADIDIGGQRLRVANGPIDGGADNLPILVAQNADLTQLVLLKTYSRRNADGSIGERRLQSFGLFDLGSPGSGAVAAVDAADLSLVSLPDDCDLLAWILASEVPPIAVEFPPLSNCSLSDCAQLRAAWIRAVHDVWRIRQMLHYIDAQYDSETRRKLWRQPAVDDKGDMAHESYSLAYYFGGYAENRFKAIHWAYDQLWKDMFDHKLNGLKLDMQCRPPAAGDVCNTTNNVPAHHVVKSNIKICSEFYDNALPEYRALLMVHEMLHHVSVPWKNSKGLPRLSAIRDLQTHHHGNACGALKTNKGYGIEKVRHFATYKADNDKTCYHRNVAFRNNDTYAWAARTIGGGVREGEIVSWPYPLKQTNPNGSGLPGNDSPCDGSSLPDVPPGGNAGDPLNKCQKINTEYICPGGGGNGTNPGLADLDLAMACPPEY